ncbi:MAG: hypothetical protein P8Z35_00655 [Ignavibacteriaceae bacterium]
MEFLLLGLEYSLDKNKWVNTKSISGEWKFVTDAKNKLIGKF